MEKERKTRSKTDVDLLSYAFQTPSPALELRPMAGPLWSNRAEVRGAEFGRHRGITRLDPVQT